MKPLTQMAHELIRREMTPLGAGSPTGCLGIDATAGNGHDTQFLAELVGPTGRVWAIDIQECAIFQTRCRLGPLVDRVDLRVADHANLKSIIPIQYHGRISVVMLNLGYLPGGEKSTITSTETTLLALNSAVELLAPGGLLSIIAYPGHPGGELEARSVAEWFCTQSGDLLETISLPPADSPPHSPQHWLVRRGN